MQNEAIYVYDSRTQFEKPIFVVYVEDHVKKVAQALFGEENPTFLFVSRVKLHAYEFSNPYQPRKKSNTRRKRR